LTGKLISMRGTDRIIGQKRVTTRKGISGATGGLFDSKGGCSEMEEKGGEPIKSWVEEGPPTQKGEKGEEVALNYMGRGPFPSQKERIRNINKPSRDSRRWQEGTKHVLGQDAVLTEGRKIRGT